MMPRWARVAAALAALGIGQASLARTQDAPPVAPAASESRLEPIRRQIEGARFEAALAAIDALVADPALGLADRAEALALRSQAHVGLGSLDAAERDWREVLRLRPGYAPVESLTPAKALERFRKVQAEIVGQIRLSLDPPGARVTIDGVPYAPDGSGVVHALAGERTVRAEHPGHDPDERIVRVEAGRQTPLTLALLPNARTVIVRTEPDGVVVRVDGVEAGTTVRRDDLAGGPAELVLENLPLGEHAFELSRPCYATQTLRDVLSVDLADRAPKRYETMRLLPARARVSLGGDPAGADVRLDGAVVGRLPIAALETCPGEHVVEVRASGRTVWRERLDLAESSHSKVDVAARPNLVWIARDGAIPTAAREFVSAFTILDRLPLPDAFAPERDASWVALGLSRECDLALALVPSARHGEADAWVLYSPILRIATVLDGPPAGAARPGWTAVTWGFSTADPGDGGAPVVVTVDTGAPAATLGLSPGSRVAAVGGRKVVSSAELRAALAAAPAGRELRVSWTDAEGRTKEGSLVGRAGPKLAAERGEPRAAALLASWALVDSIADPDHAPTALASLALLFLDAGHPDLAEQTWRRVAWGDRAGIGEGTKAYYLGVALEAQGKEDAAAALYRQAAATAARTFDDAGPEVAPAARDRLADLGVARPSAR
jgi:hypothetical protein